MSVPFDEMRNRLGAGAPGTGADALVRRDFLKLLGASLALAGLDGCSRMPAANIYPYVNQPELTPGLPQFYATAMVRDGFATGLLVESHEGRPTKIEGNPEHPASLGAAGAFEQASVLQLYDPDRARHVRHDRQSSDWNALAAALAPDALSAHLGARGAGLFLLVPPTASPFERALLERVLERYPAARIHVHSPLTPVLPALLPQYSLGDADVIVAIDADVLGRGPFHLRYAREFAERRRPESSAGMNRLYVVESSVTVTGMAADHRRAVPPRELAAFVQQLMAAIDGDEAGADPWIRALAADLHAHQGRSVVIAEAGAPTDVWALVQEINQRLGNLGRTEWFTRSPIFGAGDADRTLASLADALRAGEVDTLICSGVNAGYASAGRLELPALLRRTRESVYLGLYEDETARDCHWMVPAAHYLETWSDARAYDGSLSIVQPLIDPLSGGRSLVELLSLLLGDASGRPYDLLRDQWRMRGDVGGADDFENGWRHVLRRGVLEGSGFARDSAPAIASPAATTPKPAAPFDVVFRPHPRVHDGTYANNAWLQELPDPLTTLTWENAAVISLATARSLQVTTGDVVEIHVEGRSVRLPALPTPGHADATVTVTFGHGRDGAESVARGLGSNVYPIWPGDTFTTGGTITRAAGDARRDLAITQPHHTLEGPTPVRTITASSANRPLARAVSPLPLYRAPAALPDGPQRLQWAMTIDLSACTGCGACTVACQAENNVPVVGRDEVRRGREMHWLRIDWYTQAANEGASAAPQPMLCQHCENAPCEYVCPVEATVHSGDGLNEMVYNRCVGTRFCSNNCPYKVRRFNWFDFNAGETEGERLVHNPDVTVRERGVMEKCTFCVQRIREAEIGARANGGALRGSDVKTACQQACPSQAIAFGSLDDTDGALVQARNSPRAYAVLDELGTTPRVRYLARVRNPNRALEPQT